MSALLEAEADYDAAMNDIGRQLGLYTAPSGDEIELFSRGGVWFVQTLVVAKDDYLTDEYTSEVAARRSFADRILDDLKLRAVSS